MISESFTFQFMATGLSGQGGATVLRPVTEGFKDVDDIVQIRRPRTAAETALGKQPTFGDAT